MAFQYFKVNVQVPDGHDCISASKAAQLIAAFSWEPEIVFLPSKINNWYPSDDTLRNLLALNNEANVPSTFLEISQDYTPCIELPLENVLSIGAEVYVNNVAIREYSYDRKMAERLRILDKYMRKNK